MSQDSLPRGPVDCCLRRIHPRRKAEERNHQILSPQGTNSLHFTVAHMCVPRSSHNVLCLRGTGEGGNANVRGTQCRPGGHGQAVLLLVSAVALEWNKGSKALGTGEQEDPRWRIRVVQHTLTPCQEHGNSLECTFYACTVADTHFIFIQQFISSSIQEPIYAAPAWQTLTPVWYPGVLA